MENVKKNIRLDYAHIFIKNINVTHGIWVIYLLSKGFSMIHIGLFESLFHVSSIVFEVPTGIVADLYGRKLSRILSIVIAVLYFAILLLFDNIYMVGLAFVLLGLSYTFESGSGEALIYDSLKEMKVEDSFKKVNGRREVFYQLGSMLGLVIGGIIAMKSYNLNFIFMFFIYLVVLIVTSLMREVKHDVTESVSIIKRFKSHFIDSTKVVYKNSRLFYLIIISALFAAPVTTVFFFAQDYFLELSFTKAEIGLILGLHSLTAAIGGFIAFKIEDHFGQRKMLYIIPLGVLSCISLMVFPNLFTLGFIALGFFDSIFYVVMSDYINKITPSSKRATILSFSSFAFSIIMILIFPLIGLFIDLYSMRIANFILAGIVLCLYVLLVGILKSSKWYNKEQKA